MAPQPRRDAFRPGSEPAPAGPLPGSPNPILLPTDRQGSAPKPRPGEPVRRHNAKARFLRLAGVLLVLLGLGTIGYLVVADRLDDQAARRAQEQLSAEFQQGLAAATTLPAALADDPTIGLNSTTSTITVTTVSGEDVAGPDVRPALPGVLTETPPQAGQALGRIVIPAAGVDWLVVEGVSQADLAQGPGHMPGTALPGQPGNAVISGHRTTHGAPFYDLDLLAPGDSITVETLIGSHVYEVVELLVVAPNAVWVTEQVEGAWLTLTTCHPKGSAQERLIVFARLVDGPNATAVTALPNGDLPPRSG
jgi:LPXTG-site transpeptidase (sortase) family protein